LIPESRVAGRTNYDLPGAITSTLGMVAIVYGFTEASIHGWSAPSSVGIIAAGLALLGLFVVIESRSSHPLLPLRVVTERNRGGSYLTTTLVGMGLLAVFLFLTFYLQQTLHYSALRTGFSYLPFSIGIIIGAAVASQLVTRLRPRYLIGSGLLLAIAGMLMFTQVGLHTPYWTIIAPAEIIMSFGMGLVFVPVNNTALTGVSASDSGVASALINSTQQVGGSIGTALLNTVATTATAAYVGAHGARAIASATVHGYTVAFTVAAAVLVVAFVGAVTLINTRRTGSIALDDSTDEEAAEEVLAGATA
jgi:predicted MFS family arabinose efflux permease